MAADFRRLLSTLIRHNVEFIVVGGVAAVIHGAPVTTFDLDIVPALSPENIEALAAALSELDAVYRGRAELVPDRVTLASRGHKLLATSAGPLDVLGAIGDDEGFDELVKYSSKIEVWNLHIWVLDLVSLIRIKEAVGRDKDRAVLPLLLRTLEEAGEE